SRDGAASSPLSDGGGAGPRSRETLALLAAGAIACGVQYACELPQMLPEMAVAWIIGVVAFVGVSATLAAPALDGRWPRLALFAAAVALVVHGQIEMTFFQESSCMVAWLLIG